MLNENLYFRRIAFLVLFLIFIADSCTIGKRIDKKQYLYLNIDKITVSIDNYNSNKYISNFSPEDYKIAYINELERCLADYNIVLLNESKEHLTVKIAESFTMKLDEFKIKENYKIEQIPDTYDSNLNKEIFITNCEIIIEFRIGKEPLSFLAIKKHNIYVSKEEKLSNNRTFWQIIFGSNKDNSIYTYKELDKDVFMELTKKSARKTAAKISRIISKKLKKSS